MFKFRRKEILLADIVQCVRPWVDEEGKIQAYDILCVSGIGINVKETFFARGWPVFGDYILYTSEGNITWQRRKEFRQTWELVEELPKRQETTEFQLDWIMEYGG